jgi:preprotein translocase subunit SecD
MVRLSKLLALRWAVILGLGLFSSAAVANAACPQVGFTFVEPQASSVTRPVKVGTQTIFVRRVPITTTRDIVEIKVRADDDDDASILIKFTRAADQRLHDATTNQAGRRIAFMFDDEALVVVVWGGPYGMYTGGTQVSIMHGMARAQRLMKEIRGCTGAAVRSGGA